MKDKGYSDAWWQRRQNPAKYRNPEWLRICVVKGLKVKDIASLCHVKSCTIQRWANQLKVPMVHWRNPNYKYVVNDNFFATADSGDKAYIIGLLAADGCVSSGWEVRLVIRDYDSDILHAIKRLVKYTGPIRREQKGSSSMVRLAVSRIKWVADLAKYGVVARKSLVLPFASNIPECYVLDYLRGIWDGDGHISRRQYGLVSGSKAFITGFVRWYKLHYGTTPYTAIDTDGANPKYRVTLHRRDSRFIKDMYGHASLCMSRRQRAFNLHWANYTYTGLRPKRGPYKKHKS